MLFTGILAGMNIFFFSFVLLKKTKWLFLVPIITFLTSILSTAYGLFIVRGWDGMAFGIFGFGIILIAIIGTALLPFIRSKTNKVNLIKMEKISLIMLPLLLIIFISIPYIVVKDYWIIDKGFAFSDEKEIRVSNLLEGNKEVYIQLGEEYARKEIEIDKVSNKNGTTLITIRLVDAEYDINQERSPFIRIGIYNLKEPIKIQTSDGTPIN